MSHPFATVQPQDDQELAAQLMQEYDLLELPVVDGDNRLMGVVTADDAMDVMQAEATEDMERMAAMAPSERPYLRTRVWDLYRSRIFWLLLLMLSATFTSGIISHFEDALAAQVTLTAFIPMLMDTGGNCGSQSSVMVIRGLSLGQVGFGDWMRVLSKELQVSGLCAAALAVVNFVRLMVMTSVGFGVAATVSLTLVATVVLSDLVGSLLPILAKRLERYGIDGVIAEGCESGGHIGELTTMALVPQVVDAVSVPVIAAGGIADGRQLTAAFALGACGVQVGTCLLASEECPIHVNYKQAVLKAGANDTTVTGRSTGAPVRVLKNKMAREYLRMEKKDVPLEEMEQLTLGSLRKAVFDGDVDGGSFMAGQVAGMVHEIRPLRQIFEELMAGYAAVRKGLSE